MSAEPSAVRARLMRLRREESSPKRGGLPDWFLRRRNATVEETAAAWCDPPDETWLPRIPLEEGRNAAGVFAFREQVHAAEETHGAYELGEIDAVEPRAWAVLGRDSSLGALSPDDALYLDIETSGLSGGAGTYAFLVGLGRFEQGRFRLWQGFLRTPGEEHALLAEVAARMAACSGLVSFFGKSFDRHRLADKMSLHGVRPPFASLPHFDLYYACQRLYGSAFLDGRLRTMERSLTGVDRVDDLPGSQAPAAWFDYLAGRPSRIEAVFRHNRDDVKSLVVLAAHLGRSHLAHRRDGGELGGPLAERAEGWARLHFKLGGYEQALRFAEAALAERAMDGNLEFLRAECLRRLGDIDRALQAYAALAEDAHGTFALQSEIARAKILEHGRRDFTGALLACERALERKASTSRIQAAELERRAARLRRKLSASGANDPSIDEGNLSAKVHPDRLR